MVHFKNPFKHKDARDGKDVLDDYVVGKTLGEGGYGTVKQAHHKGEAQGVDVAIKIVPRARVAPGRNDVKEITRRFRIMQSLAEHPHIVRLIDWRITKTNLFAFYEFCRGKDLFDRILDAPGGRFTEAQARDATRALAEALCFIHERGLMHRDIKPENCLYRTADGPYDDLVLADFGLSREVEPDEVIQGAAGSPGYWSPEMCAGKGYGILADEWALGIVVYAMLSGRSPFRSLEADDLRKEGARGEISYPRKYWDGVSPTAKEFVERLLQPDPKKRATVREALAHKWLTQPDASLPEPQAVATTDSAISEASAGKLERRPTHGLTPAGLSMRFDKPPLQRQATVTEDAGSPVEIGKRVLSTSKTSDSEIEGMHVTTTEDVLSGSISQDKLDLLATLDDSAAATPIEGRSREPSHADLSAALHNVKVQDDG